MARPLTLYIFAAFAFILLVYTLLPASTQTPTPPQSERYTGKTTYEGPTVEWTQSTKNSDNSGSESSAEKSDSNHGYTSRPAENSTPSDYDSSDQSEIPRLIRAADLRFSSLLASRSTTLEEAAKAYRARRGRHPPPGFDLWFKYAQENDAIVVEEFWDQVYHDLEPFWAVNPALIRAQARDLGMAVMIKDKHTDIRTDWFWHVIWKRMMEEIAHMLPDMIIPLNSMDEPRMMTPYSQISELVAAAHAQKKMPEPSHVRKTTTGWGEEVETDAPDLPFVEWFVVPPYSFAREACPPESAIRNDFKLYNSGKVPVESGASMNWMSSHLFVENSTLWSDTCQDPAIAAYHAALISPLSGRTTQVLQPLFGGSKFSVNNDILLPAPMYWNGEERFEQDDVTPWAEKSNSVMWRGTATGGRHNALNWPHFHRHRFVALSNGTKYQHAGEHDRIYTPVQKQAATASLPQSLREHLPAFLQKRTDVAFTDLFCDIPGEWGKCWYMDDEFAIVPGMPLVEQYTSKFLPDIDGNSFSGRYRSFLYSNSLPIKATMFREWHDSRLIAWKHFVPMNNRFTDYYSLIAYFGGCEKEVCGETIPSHDKDAEAIATAGSDWAKKVLRKVDMQIYVARVLLEYARITDDHREMVGWVDDLLR